MNVHELFPPVAGGRPEQEGGEGDCEVCGAAVPIDDWICAACFLAITPPEGEA